MVNIIEDANVPGLGRIVHTECPHNELELEEERLSKAIDEVYHRLQWMKTEEYSGREDQKTKEEREEQERQDHLLHQEKARVQREKWFCKECSTLDKKLEIFKSVGARIMTGAELATAITKTVVIPEIPFEYEHPGQDDFKEMKKRVKPINHPNVYERLLEENLHPLGVDGTYVREGWLIVPSEKPRVYLLRDALAWKSPAPAEELELGADFNIEQFLASLPPEDYLGFESEEDVSPIRYEDFGKDKRTRWLFGEAAEEYGRLLLKYDMKRRESAVAYCQQKGIPMGLGEPSLFRFEPSPPYDNRSGLQETREMFLEGKIIKPYAWTLYVHPIQFAYHFNNCFLMPSMDSKGPSVRGLIP